MFKFVEKQSKLRIFRSEKNVFKSLQETYSIEATPTFTFWRMFSGELGEMRGDRMVGTDTALLHQTLKRLL